MFAQLQEDPLEPPGPLTHFDHFDQQGGEVSTGASHGPGQRIAPVDLVEDSSHFAALAGGAPHRFRFEHTPNIDSCVQAATHIVANSR
jgi:hypothetical protein